MLDLQLVYMKCDIEVIIFITPQKSNMEPGNDGFQVRNLRTSKGPPFSGEPCLFLGVYITRQF